MQAWSTSATNYWDIHESSCGVTRPRPAKRRQSLAVAEPETLEAATTECQKRVLCDISNAKGIAKYG